MRHDSFMSLVFATWQTQAFCRLCLLLGVVFSSVFLSAQTEKKYSDGVLILNEDWYGHNNSSLNYWREDGVMEYKVFQKENAGYSFGCTAQYAQLFFDRLYVISKQDQDPGEGTAVRGARIVVADATTLKMQARIDTIFQIDGQSAADGRGFVGVSREKGYVGTSNGIFVMDLQTDTISHRIPHTENPLITGGEQNSDGTGPLYQNQIGMMIAIGSDGKEIGYPQAEYRSQDDEASYVYAIYQDRGLLQIDPAADTILSTLPGCFSTMTLSADGTLWLARNTNQEAQNYPYGMAGERWDGYELIGINTQTGQPIDTIDLWQFGVADLMVEQTWYAWTAGNLCASKRENKLYWVQPSRWDWFGGKTDVWELDLNSRKAQVVFSTKQDRNTIYSAALRIDPRTETMYVAAYLGSNIATNRWIIYSRTVDGTVESFTPIRNYWYPAIFLFPESTTTDLDSSSSGSFSAQHISAEIQSRKIIHNNTILILMPDGNAYTILGQKK